MRSRNMENRQLGAWLFAGLSAPLAQFAGGMSWQLTALTVVICLPIGWVVGRMKRVQGKWLSLVELVWMVCVLASIGRWIAGSWSSGNVYPAVPLILMALGAAAAVRGSEQAARAGSVMFWLVAILYSIVTAAGVSQAEWKELVEIGGKPDFRLAVILLLPAVAVFQQGDNGELTLKAVIGMGAFAILLSILVTGGLSLGVAQSVEKPFHKWVEGLNLAGTLQRFEASVSVALSMGWFALASYVLSVAGALTNQVKEGCYGKGVWSVAAIAGVIMLSKVEILPELLAIGSVFLWAVIPLVMALVCRNKKLKISENNA